MANLAARLTRSMRYGIEDFTHQEEGKPKMQKYRDGNLWPIVAQLQVHSEDPRIEF